VEDTEGGGAIMPPGTWGCPVEVVTLAWPLTGEGDWLPAVCGFGIWEARLDRLCFCALYFSSLSMLSVGWSNWASREKLVLTGDVSPFDFGVGVDELSSCFSRAFWVWVSGWAVDSDPTESKVEDLFPESKPRVAVKREVEAVMEGNRVDATIEPCIMFVVATIAVGPVLTVLIRPVQMFSLPVLFIDITLVSRDTMEEQTLATVASGWLRTSTVVPWNGMLAARMEFAVVALIVRAAVEVMEGIGVGALSGPAPSSFEG
jgi:hypothetical protein